MPEGVLEKFTLTVKLFEMRKEQTAAILTGLLQAEECRLARQESLSGYVTAPQQAAMVVTNHGNTQQWTHRQEPKGAVAKPEVCWNCGEPGHKYPSCSKPIIKPLKFKPDNFMYRTRGSKKSQKQTGRPNVTA